MKEEKSYEIEMIPTEIWNIIMDYLLKSDTYPALRDGVHFSHTHQFFRKIFLSQIQRYPTNYGLYNQIDNIFKMPLPKVNENEQLICIKKLKTHPSLVLLVFPTQVISWDYEKNTHAWTHSVKHELTSYGFEKEENKFYLKYKNQDNIPTRHQRYCILELDAENGNLLNSFDEILPTPKRKKPPKRNINSMQIISIEEGYWKYTVMPDNKHYTSVINSSFFNKEYSFFLGRQVDNSFQPENYENCIHKLCFFECNNPKAIEIKDYSEVYMPHNSHSPRDFILFDSEHELVLVLFRRKSEKEKIIYRCAQWDVKSRKGDYFDIELEKEVRNLHLLDENIFIDCDNCIYLSPLNLELKKKTQKEFSGFTI